MQTNFLSTFSKFFALKNIFEEILSFSNGTNEKNTGDEKELHYPNLAVGRCTVCFQLQESYQRIVNS